ncbi:hypothetical protein GTP46_00235 [Duganella sp. FT135W]|uniref:Uncharacterized protein n=1 Tax=Duganella flavida TaxID=2692175 RepID=A0A6L8K3F2_9BURK|nr:hypothetical protein [Duganella flavida]MYM21077.1 hypothetical protein [Duganella flavida]
MRAKLLLLILVYVSLVACTKSPSQWQEEVKLSSGETIVITRQTDYVSGGGEWASNPDLSRADIRHLKFTFPLNSSQPVEWHSQPEPGGLYPESPLIFDIESGVPVVIAVGSVSRECPEYRRYAHLSTGWQRQPLSAADWQRATNLLIDSSNEYLITLEQKQKLNETGAYSKRIRTIDPSVKACPEITAQWKIKVLKVQVKSDVFIVNGHTYATSAELTAALKTLPRPDEIDLMQERGISRERRNEAVAAIRDTGLNVLIGVEGNEVFH